FIAKCVRHTISVVGIWMTHNLLVSFSDHAVAINILEFEISCLFCRSIVPWYIVADIFLRKQSNHFQNIDAVDWIADTQDCIRYCETIWNNDLRLTWRQGFDLVSVVSNIERSGPL